MSSMTGAILLQKQRNYILCANGHVSAVWYPQRTLDVWILIGMTISMIPTLDTARITLRNLLSGLLKSNISSSRPRPRCLYLL